MNQTFVLGPCFDFELIIILEILACIRALTYSENEFIKFISALHLIVAIIVNLDEWKSIGYCRFETAWFLVHNHHVQIFFQKNRSPTSLAIKGLR